MKNGSEPISIYGFSRRIRIRIQNWTKTYPKADFDQFSKNNLIKITVYKINFFKKFVKIGFWGGFGPILDPDSNSA